jgi:nucleotide-binding universal stress UspA family protein
MKRLLVAIDGSEPSKRAAKAAAEMAPKLGLSLSFVHVVPGHAVLNEWQLGGDELEMREQRKEDGLAMLARVAAQIGVAPDLACVEGTPAEAIEQIARQDDVSLLCLGSRGRTLLGGVLIGSVAHRLVHICKKPTLVVH